MQIDSKSLEKYSSAATLSDMEIFVFPELLYSLTLANIMSPRLWAWRDDPWFAKMDRLTPYRRVLRLKQFIIDHYEFNLDLDTWGLTTQEAELARFRPFLDEETISRSNALFGYEGDKYYFDLDIRRHFGLDKYTAAVIPYWKTETVEAMDAFRHKEGYRIGAGECVSLSTLYAAALFIVCGIPLEDIFLIATPLHSQNFVLVQDGVLTNNRRLVTKNMWFNGTELTEKAQRALRHEKVTIVSHLTGHLHTVYPEATIDPAAYARFGDSLRTFLRTDLTMEILLNFLRSRPDRQTCFQLRHTCRGRPHFIPVEKLYHHEHSSAFKVSDATRLKLLDLLEDDDCFPEPIAGRVVLNDLEDFLRDNPVDLSDRAAVNRLLSKLDCAHFKAMDAMKDVIDFARLEPRLPCTDGRVFEHLPPLALRPEMAREEIIAALEARRAVHPVADLAFYAARDLSRTDWAPFAKAALERNPVCAEGAKALDEAAAEAYLRGLPDDSIYDGPRAAQPDEVWNFRRGDGFEKALCLAAIWKKRHPQGRVALDVEPGRARLRLDGAVSAWRSAKNLTGRLEG